MNDDGISREQILNFAHMQRQSHIASYGISLAYINLLAPDSRESQTQTSEPIW